MSDVHLDTKIQLCRRMEVLNDLPMSTVKSHRPTKYCRNDILGFEKLPNFTSTAKGICRPTILPTIRAKTIR